MRKGRDMALFSSRYVIPSQFQCQSYIIDLTLYPFKGGKEGGKLNLRFLAKSLGMTPE